MFEIRLGSGHTLQLLAQRAAFWPARRMLLVADVHLGKAASFRRLGVPVPEATTAATLDRLSAAIEQSGAAEVVVLGDLLHSRAGRGAATLDAVGRWRRDRHPALTLTLVRGNHDGHAGDPPPDWDVRCVDPPLRLDGLALVHEPQPVAGCYALGGHLHPAARIAGRGPGALTLPCFHFGAAVGVLPAFGEFTGRVVLRRASGDRVIVIADDAVRELPEGLRPDGGRALHCD